MYSYSNEIGDRRSDDGEIRDRTKMATRSEIGRRRRDQRSDDYDNPSLTSHSLPCNRSLASRSFPISFFFVFIHRAFLRVKSVSKWTRAIQVTPTSVSATMLLTKSRNDLVIDQDSKRPHKRNDRTIFSSFVSYHHTFDAYSKSKSFAWICSESEWD